MATQLDLYFPSINATVIGANALSISIGTTVEIGSTPDGAVWFLNNDHVLNVTGNTITSLVDGVSTIKFIKADQIVGSFDITVTPDIAASLGLSAGTPVIK